MNRTLWMIQILLAFLFLFAGGVKLILPLDQLAKQAPQLPPLFLKFVGMCEVAGGIGLILPRLLRIRPGLTPLAATCLIGIMIGAVVVTFLSGPPALALIPAAVGFLLAFVAYGRLRLAA